MAELELKPDAYVYHKWRASLPSLLSSATLILITHGSPKHVLDTEGLIELTTDVKFHLNLDLRKRTAASKVIKDGRVKKGGTTDRMARTTTKRIQDA